MRQRPPVCRCLALAFLCRCWFDAWTFAKPSRSDPKVERRWKVSNYGRCCNLFGTVTFGSQKPTGYHAVTIEGKMYLVHRLVKFAFDGPPESEIAQQVNHLDCNKSNNRLDNLRYATPSENSQHFHASGLRECTNSKRALPVMWRASGSSRWNINPSCQSAAECLGLSRSTVSRYCKGLRSSKGYEFKFAHNASSAGSLEGEEWRQVRDPKSGRVCCSALVSSLGRLKFKGGRISRGSKSKAGYFTTTLRALKPPVVFVHRLVAATFFGDPPSRKHTHINHKDGDKGNNAIENLEYVTPAQNIAHSYANGGSRLGRCDSQAVESRRLSSTGRWTRHISQGEAARALGVNQGNVCHCISGRARQTGGYEFRLAAETADLPGEVWREVDLAAHLQDRASRKRPYYERRKSCPVGPRGNMRELLWIANGC